MSNNKHSCCRMPIQMCALTWRHLSIMRSQRYQNAVSMLQAVSHTASWYVIEVGMQCFALLHD